jgi:antiviral helicase SLH1
MRSKPKEVIEAISDLLSSTHPDDAISGELADLVGFEDIELVADLLTSRSYFVNAVSIAINRIASMHLHYLVAWTGSNDS